MPRNDDGEFELILGNKQLLSVFFLVVVLLTVFFTLGYVVGRSSGPVGQVETARTKPGETAAPLVIDPSSEKPSASSGSSVSRPVSPVTAPPPTRPVNDPPKPAQRTDEEPRPAVKPVTKPVTHPDETASTPTPVSGSNEVQEPPAGQTFLQVVSVMKVQADTLADTLRKQRGLPTQIAPGPPDSQLLRVLVGPFKDPAAMAKAKEDLQTIGFHPIVKKY